MGSDNQYIEPLHLLLALLGQDDGAARSLLQRAGVNAGALASALKNAFERLPKVSGTGGETQVGRELMSLLDLAEGISGIALLLNRACATCRQANTCPAADRSTEGRGWP